MACEANLGDIGKYSVRQESYDIQCERNLLGLNVCRGCDASDDAVRNAEKVSGPSCFDYSGRTSLDWKSGARCSR